MAKSGTLIYRFGVNNDKSGDRPPKVHGQASARGETVHGSDATIAAYIAQLIAAKKPAGESRINPVTIGLLGRGIQSSRTPIMHEREGARLGMPYTYVLLDFDTMNLADAALGEVLDAAEHLGFAGLNVTHPFKQSVIPHLTELAADAKAIGAVNTVVLRKGSRAGHNTDCWGFQQSFHDGMTGCPLRRVTQFGAGGAGAAVGYALLGLGVEELTVVDIEPARAILLAKRLSKLATGHVATAVSAVEPLRLADGIVNTTPVGMEKYPGLPFAADLMSARHWVAEIIYFPQETELLRQAHALGCRTLPGTGMAIYQAVRAFELFTGIAPDRSAMATHFEAAA